MFRFAAVVAALALAAGSGAARAQSFDDFMAICDASGVESGAARLAAEGLGWRSAPAWAARGFASDDPEDPLDPVFVMVAPGDEAGLLIFARGRPPIGSGETVDSDVCMMATETVSSAIARRRFVDLKRGEVVDEDSDSYMVYSRGPDGYRDEGAMAEASEAEILRAARDRPLFMMGSGEAPVSMLILVRVRGDAPSPAE